MSMISGFFCLRALFDGRIEGANKEVTMMKTALLAKISPSFNDAVEESPANPEFLQSILDNMDCEHQRSVPHLYHCGFGPGSTD